MAQIYNELARGRPDLVKCLSEDSWTFDRYAQVVCELLPWRSLTRSSFGQQPAYSVRPLLYHEDGKIMFSFSRRPLVGSSTSARTRGIPSLSELQVEALNVVQMLAERLAVVLDLEPGDLLFWNNLGLLHARNGFTDSSEQKRHLIRLWLHNEEKGSAIAEAIRQPWKDAFESSSRQQLWPVHPIRDRQYISTQQRSSGHG